MRLIEYLRSLLRRLAGWGRTLFPFAAPAYPVENQSDTEETIVTMPERPDATPKTKALPAADEAPDTREVTLRLDRHSAEPTPDPVSAADAAAETATDEDDLEGAAEHPAEQPIDDLAWDDPALTPLVSLLESLLFVAEEAVTPDKLAKALDRTIGEVEAGLVVLAQRCEHENRGVRVQRRSGRVQLVTDPAAAQAVETFLNLDLSTQLSGPALEALAVVAYQQPVTRAQIEAVRGVDCSGVLRKLQQQGLIEEVGRLETIGRPILYGVTDLFLQHFGLTSMSELPHLPELDADSLAAAVELVEEGGM